MPKRGRPRKDDASRKSITLGIRVTPALRDQLEAARNDSSRTLSQEIEARLRLSFGEQQRAQEEFGGATNYFLFQAISRGIIRIQERTGRQWWEDRYTFNECQALMAAVWSRFKPRGRNTIPKALKDERELGRRLSRAVISPLELALEDRDLGPIAYAASFPVGTKVKKSALAEVRRAAQRLLNDAQKWPESKPGETLGQYERRVQRRAKK